ncbi:hypothetical protein MUP01_00640 [Candidatus Bathyarchaeota archaeon]|nr:hypothetical protein [Candidatus Bathyarchaeota archaeon]
MKKPVVQDATEPKPKNEPSPEPAQVVSKEEALTNGDKEAAQPVEALIEIPQIDEDTKRMLQKAGFSWDSITNAFTKINAWAAKVDHNEKALADAIKGVSNEGIAEALNQKLQAGAAKQRAELTEKMKDVPQGAAQGGGGILEYAKIAREMGIIGGGASENPLQQKLLTFSEKVLDNALNKMTQPDRFTQYFEDEIAKAKAKVMAEVVMKAGAQ